MKKIQIIKMLTLLGFVAAFVTIGLYVYTNIVKKNNFKPDQFKNAR